jgi:hypothetical protein
MNDVVRSSGCQEASEATAENGTVWSAEDTSSFFINTHCGWAGGAFFPIHHLPGLIASILVGKKVGSSCLSPSLIVALSRYSHGFYHFWSIVPLFLHFRLLKPLLHYKFSGSFEPYCTFDLNLLSCLWKSKKMLCSQ